MVSRLSSTLRRRFKTVAVPPDHLRASISKLTDTSALRRHNAVALARKYGRRAAGIVAVNAGLAFTVVAAVISGQGRAASGSLSVLFVVLSALAQFGAAALFSSDHAPNRRVFRNSLRRLYDIATDVHAARVEVEAAVDDVDPSVAVSALGKVSVRLSYAEDELERNLLDWVSVYHDDQNDDKQVGPSKKGEE